MEKTAPQFTQEQVDKIISERLERAKSKYAEEIKALTTQLEDAQKELTPFKQEARKAKLKELLPKEANPELSDDIIALTNISDDMKDEDISKAFQETIAKRDYLKATTSNDVDAPVKKTTEVSNDNVDEGEINLTEEHIDKNL